LLTLKTEGQTKSTENLTEELKNWNKFLAYPGLAQSGFELKWVLEHSALTYRGKRT